MFCVICADLLQTMRRKCYTVTQTVLRFSRALPPLSFNLRRRKWLLTFFHIFNIMSILIIMSYKYQLHRSRLIRGCFTSTKRRIVWRISHFDEVLSGMSLHASTSMSAEVAAFHCRDKPLCHIDACFSRTTTVPSIKKVVKPTYWCVLCRENGALEIYSLPDFKLAFCVRNFAVAPKVLMDSGTIG